MRLHSLLIYILLLLANIPTTATAQVNNTSQETFDYQLLRQGEMALAMTLDNQPALFVLALNEKTVLFQEEKSTPETVQNTTHTLSLGKSLYAEKQSFAVESAPATYREQGVKGLLGMDMFRNVVLTIDAKNHKLTISAPYRPDFMKLFNRIRLNEAPQQALRLPVMVNQQNVSLPLRLDQSSGLTLSQEQCQQLGVATSCSLKIAHTEWETAIATTKEAADSFLGNGILQHGLLSIDFTKASIYFQAYDENAIVYKSVSKSDIVVETGKPTDIGRTYFLDHVWDYTASTPYTYRDSVPCVIDFWANWCIPCKRLSPLIDELAKKYAGKIKFYKVNYDQEKKLAADLGIGALPTLLVIPTKGKPQTIVGPKHEELEQRILEYTGENTKE